jgi:hypothetical protein
MDWRGVVFVCVLASSVAVPGRALAQGAVPPAAHDHAQMPAEAGPWRLMQDGVVFGLFNSQGGPRGGEEFVVPNWWMGMLMREKGTQQLTFSVMLSLDPATVGTSGYREIFQVGEALEGEPLVDRQHPHDFLMQLAAAWRRNLSEGTSVNIAAGVAGEPTLGPIAFMHRGSAAGLPLAPLGHHTFDSTHISFGVVTASVDRGRWTVEGSVFNGREPDEHRWNIDFGAMDSVAGRVWFRPNSQWAIQVSSGRLREPEELEPGDAVRTTASGSWFRQDDRGFTGVTVGYGVNAAHGERRHGAFGEFTTERAANSAFGRLEIQQVETAALLHEPGHDETAGAPSPARVAALTLGAARRILVWRGFEGALGGQVTLYGVPRVLRPSHGEHPVSAQAFFRLRLPAGDMGRMWNMFMSQGHRPGADHSGHVMR